MDEPCDPDYLAVSAASIIACDRIVAGYAERGIKPPFPRVYVCAYCGELTSAPSISFDYGDHRYTWPSVCANEACGDAVVEDQVRQFHS